MPTHFLRNLAIMTALGALLGRPAQAQISIIATPSAAPAGGSGSFDVTLTDTGTSSYQVGGFSFELSVPSTSGVTFTSADTNTTVTYIFNGASFGENVNPPFPNQDFIASDTSGNASGYVTVNPGDTFGLGHISFDVAAGTFIGSVPVGFIANGTSLTDGAGAPIGFTTTDGTILVAPAPEPSQVASLGLGLLGLSGLLLRAHRRA